MSVIMFKIFQKMYLMPFQNEKNKIIIIQSSGSASTRGRRCFTPPATSFITAPKSPRARTPQTPFNVSSSPGCSNPWIPPAHLKLPPLLFKSSSINPQLSPRVRRDSVALRASSHSLTEQLCLQHTAEQQRFISAWANLISPYLPFYWFLIYPL